MRGLGLAIYCHSMRHVICRDQEAGRDRSYDCDELEFCLIGTEWVYWLASDTMVN